MDKYKEIAAAVLIPMLDPPREIVGIKRDMARDCFIRNISLLITDDHFGQSISGWFFLLLTKDVIKQ